MASKKDLLEKCAEYGIEVAETDTAAVLAQKIDEYKAAHPELTEKPEKKAVFYHVKRQCYVDATRRIAPGLYRLDEPVERLDIAKSNVVEKFDAVPEVVIHSVANSLRVKVKTDKGDYRKKDEILEDILADYRPF
jgi:hypothetical protein